MFGKCLICETNTNILTWILARKHYRFSVNALDASLHWCEWAVNVILEVTRGTFKHVSNIKYNFNEFVFFIVMNDYALRRLTVCYVSFTSCFDYTRTRVYACGRYRTEQNRTDYLFDVNYTVSSQSNAIIIIYISRSQILLKCLNQVVVLI